MNLCDLQGAIPDKSIPGRFGKKIEFGLKGAYFSA